MDPYLPEDLPISNIQFSRLITAVGNANTRLAEYNGLLQAMVNPVVLLSPMTRQEAVLSSRIEGTIATLEEVLEHEAGQRFGEEKENDIQEILNYRKVLALSAQFLRERPIRLSFLLEAHKMLMGSVRGQDKDPGKFRESQNWIGLTKATPIEKALFVPPNPFVLQDHLIKWEKYLEYDDVDPLVQSAIMHAQFELLHPFKDGNGRMGRILIPLFLYSKKRLKAPMFYISGFLEDHREEYYSRLRGISEKKEWTEWIEFFLHALIVQSDDNITKAKEILDFYGSMKERIRTLTHSQYSFAVIDAIFDRPIFASSDFIVRSKISKPTAHKILRQLLESKILITLRKSEGRAPSILAFPSLLNIVEGRAVL
jgi:Fic family protein